MNILLTRWFSTMKGSFGIVIEKKPDGKLNGRIGQCFGSNQEADAKDILETGAKIAPQDVIDMADAFNLEPVNLNTFIDMENMTDEGYIQAKNELAHEMQNFESVINGAYIMMRQKYAEKNFPYKLGKIYSKVPALNKKIVPPTGCVNRFLMQNVAVMVLENTSIQLRAQGVWIRKDGMAWTPGEFVVTGPVEGQTIAKFEYCIDQSYSVPKHLQQ